MMNISRASITEKGEHSSRQIISLEMSGSPNLKVPTAKDLNSKLPNGIHIFKVIEMPQGFSARRTCEGRTFEFIFPTYVLAPPAEGTMYSNPPLPEENDDFAYPSDMVFDAPAGGMFRTMVRGKPEVLKSTESITSKEVVIEQVQEQPKPRRFASWFSKLLFGKKVPEKVQKQQEMGRTLPRTLRASTHRKDAPPIPLEMSSNKDEKSATHKGSLVAEDNDAFTGMGGFFSTLKRTMSTKRRKSAFKEEESSDDLPVQYFEPLDIPMDEAYLSNLASYRITESQMKTLKTIISLYNGTHNWHNYIPGASANDSRCFLRILNVELAAPQMHDGLEWVRVKVQAKAFARYQIRKMIALAIMVIRTNTPVSVIGNSFGYAKIELPEVPALGLILDEPHYNQFNDYASRNNNCVIDFEEIKV
jgi:tRNA pseudouridine(38-40) synthase